MNLCLKNFRFFTITVAIAALASVPVFCGTIPVELPPVDPDGRAVVQIGESFFLSRGLQ